jgi:hypothetical protein
MQAAPRQALAVLVRQIVRSLVVLACLEVQHASASSASAKLLPPACLHVATLPSAMRAGMDGIPHKADLTSISACISISDAHAFSNLPKLYERAFREESPCTAVQADAGAEDDSEEDEAPRKSATKAAKRGGAQKRPGKAAKRSRNIFIDDAAEEDDDVRVYASLRRTSAWHASCHTSRGIQNC